MLRDQSICHPGNLVSHSQVLRNQCQFSLMHVWPLTKVDVVVQAVAVEAQLGKEPIHQMVSMCAREITLGNVMM
jgi:hypothetical protein